MTEIPGVNGAVAMLLFLSLTFYSSESFKTMYEDVSPDLQDVVSARHGNGAVNTGRSFASCRLGDIISGYIRTLMGLS